jgi:hypothetical protein
MAITINGTGSITGLSAGGLPNDSVTSANIASLATTKLTGQVADANAPSGSVIQIVQSVLTSAVAGNSQSYTSILTASITPSSSSNKVFILLNAAMGAGTSGNVQCQITRNGTHIYLGDASSSRAQVTGMAFDNFQSVSVVPMSISYLDSPATTSAVTYDFRLREPANSSYRFYVNRSDSDNDAIYRGRAATSFILMEIAG